MEMKRTGSMASLVGPDVTRALRPLRLPLREKNDFILLTMTSGSSIRPLPSRPLASSPEAASIISTPRARSMSIDSWVAGCAYMSRSMAGAAITGHLADRYVVSSRLSAMPCAILDRVLAEAGAIRYRSAQRPSET